MVKVYSLLTAVFSCMTGRKDYSEENLPHWISMCLMAS